MLERSDWPITFCHFSIVTVIYIDILQIWFKCSLRGNHTFNFDCILVVSYLFLDIELLVWQ